MGIRNGTFVGKISSWDIKQQNLFDHLSVPSDISKRDQNSIFYESLP